MCPFFSQWRHVSSFAQHSYGWWPCFPWCPLFLSCTAAALCTLDTAPSCCAYFAASSIDSVSRHFCIASRIKPHTSRSSVIQCCIKLSVQLVALVLQHYGQWIHPPLGTIVKPESLYDYKWVGAKMSFQGFHNVHKWLVTWFLCLDQAP